MSFFNPNIPQSTDFLSDSQQDIQNNFQQLDTSFGLNHFAFSNVTANNGKHSYIEMVNEAMLPAGLATGQGTLYTKDVNSESQMFYSPDDTSKEYQMTTAIDAEFAKFGTNTNYSGTLNGGWTFLPGGLILQYGVTEIAAAPLLLTVTFPFEFPNAVFSINVTKLQGAITQAGPAFILLNDATTTSSFTALRTTGLQSGMYWMAIGN